MKLSKMFPSKWLSADDLPDEGAVFTIAKDVEEVQIVADEKPKPVLYFRETDKGLVVNVTNGNSIAKVLGSDETSDWVGQQVYLYPTETSFGGKPVACIRVKLRPAKQTASPRTRQPVVDDDDSDIPF